MARGSGRMLGVLESTGREGTPHPGPAGTSLKAGRRARRRLTAALPTVGLPRARGSGKRRQGPAGVTRAGPCRAGAGHRVALAVREGSHCAFVCEGCSGCSTRGTAGGRGP